MDIAAIRAQFPDYGDMTDSALADAVYGKFYSDMPREEFNTKLGIAPTVAPPLYGPDGSVVQPAPAAAAPGPRGIVERTVAGAKGGFGEAELGFAEKTKAAAPAVTAALEPIAVPVEAALRGIAAAVGGIAGAMAGLAEKGGLSRAEADRLQRDFGKFAEVAAVEAPIVTPRAIAKTPAVSASERGTISIRPTPKESVPVKAAEDIGELSAKTSSEFKEKSQGFYKQMEDAGVVIAPESYGAAVKEIGQTLVEKRINPSLHPESTAVLKELADLQGGPVSLSTLDQIRQLANDAAASPKPGERRLAGIIKDKLDDYIGRIGEKDVNASMIPPELATSALVQARELWSTARKLETIEGLVENAQRSAGKFSGSGFENALTTEFRNLSKNKKLMRTFSEQEQQAIDRVVKGGTAAKIARFGGRYAPSGPVATFTGGGIGATIGTFLGVGPTVGATVGSGVALTARQIATAITKRNVEALQNVIRTVGDSKTATGSVQRGNRVLKNLAEPVGRAAVISGSTRAQDDKREKRSK